MLQTSQSSMSFGRRKRERVLVDDNSNGKNHKRLRTNGHNGLIKPPVGNALPKSKTAPKFKYPFLARTLKYDGTGMEREIVFEFCYLDQRRRLGTHVEVRLEPHCPLCNYRMTSRKRLLGHLERFHGDQFSFQGTISEAGKTQISARPNLPLGGETPLKCDKTYQYVLCPSMRRKRSRQKVQPIPADTLAQEEVDPNPKAERPPRRQYYHSRSRLPMRPGDWGVDSDDESDGQWMDDLGQAGLNEFVDLTAVEKRLLDMWKRFIRADTVIADSEVPTMCVAFIRQHSKQLEGLRPQLLKMLVTFFEHRLVSSDHILACMELFDQLQGPSSEEDRAKEA